MNKFVLFDIVPDREIFSQLFTKLAVQLSWSTLDLNTVVGDPATLQ
jgi:hypothetical protein